MIVKNLQPTVDAMVQQTVIDCLDGDYIDTPKDKSYEVLHYQTGLSNPAARIMTSEARPLNIVVALARWVWLMAGNDRLEDIAYYEPKVRSFTDNGLAVPGSNYGARLRNQSRIDQIGSGVIQRLSLDPGSRQAAAVIWRADDAVTDDSRDIPCTHGMFFHIREDRLQMCVTMRSNNAFRILPFNVFEFTMLQEVVAAALDVPLGDYVHWAASMHVYDNEFEMPATRELAFNYGGTSIVMPPIPSENVLEQVNLLCQLEAKLRHAGTMGQIEEIKKMARDLLNPYWLMIFEPLLLWTVWVKHESSTDREWIKDIVPQSDSLFDLTTPILAKTKVPQKGELPT